MKNKKTPLIILTSVLLLIIIKVSGQNNLELNSNNFIISIPGQDLNIDTSFSDLDSINNYNIPYFYNNKYLSVIVKHNIDSLYFKPKKEIDIPISIKYNGKSKEINLVFIESPSAKYHQSYIENNLNSIQVEIPELYELIHIAIALTKFNSDSNYKINPNNEINFMINKKTDYHKKVLNYFSNHSNHPLVKFLDMQFVEDFSRYHLFTANSYCMYIKESNKIKHKKIYSSIWPGKSHFKTLIPLIQSFYQETNFDKFYTDNKEYYSFLIANTKKEAALVSIHKWLEKVSGVNYQSFIYILSPLVYGGHKTQRFNQGDFNECLVFVPTIKHKSMTETENFQQKKSLKLIGQFFTEIDHNYVNPISEKYSKLIDKSIKNLQYWNTKSTHGHYENKLATFNEYYTHALFLIYAKENFNKDDYNSIAKFWIDQESNPNNRGFTKFREFFKKIEEIYLSQINIYGCFDLDKSIEPLLNWMRKQE